MQPKVREKPSQLVSRMDVGMDDAAMHFIIHYFEEKMLNNKNSYPKKMLNNKNSYSRTFLGAGG